MPAVEQICPWSDFEQAALHFCERELCGWITQPANTWSNLAYMLVGAWLIRLAIREGHRSLAAIGVIEVLIGIGSFFFHMSSTHLGEVVDVGAMYMLSCYALVTNLDRYRSRVGRPLSARFNIGLYLSLVLSSITAISLLKGEVGVWLFAAQAVVAGHLETRMYRKLGPEKSYRAVLQLLGTFGVAWAFWWADILGLMCDPDNHWFQGHAVWHVVNSLVFYFLYRFYSEVRR